MTVREVIRWLQECDPNKYVFADAGTITIHTEEQIDIASYNPDEDHVLLDVQP